MMRFRQYGPNLTQTMIRSTTATLLLLALVASVLPSGCTSETTPTSTGNSGATNGKGDSNKGGSGGGAAQVGDPSAKPGKVAPPKDPGPETGKPAEPAKKPVVAEKKLFTKADVRAAKIQWMICTTCHGNTGEGDGLAGLALNPRPRSFGDKKWQASVNDERLFKVIKGGGKEFGLNPAMVGYPHLPEGTVYALIDKIRGFGK